MRGWQLGVSRAEDCLPVLKHAPRRERPEGLQLRRVEAWEGDGVGICGWAVHRSNALRAMVLAELANGDRGQSPASPWNFAEMSIRAVFGAISYQSAAAHAAVALDGTV
jgi:hypothetical protein